MNTTSTTHRLRRAAVVALTAGAAVTGVVAGVSPAFAAPAHHVVSASSPSATPDGLFAVQRCTTMTGSVQFQPGLVKTARTETALVNATLDGCSLDGGAVSGQGTLTAVLTGSASTTSQALSGTYTINWPAGENLNPSTGRLSLSGPSLNVVSFSGTGTAGAFTGLPVSGAWFISGQTGSGTSRKPITAETFVNTVPLQVVENLG